MLRREIHFLENGTTIWKKTEIIQRKKHEFLCNRNAILFRLAGMNPVHFIQIGWSDFDK